ncbi:hypothetical protein ABIE27_003925 [Paenibacillus sp. 4624]|uniref:hypothetical protein n=1 Tax=Paenibacillus sp. 4624 TaxID=3156453 RepID=UPI0013751EF3
MEKVRKEQNVYDFSGLFVMNRIRPAYVPDMPSIFSAQPPDERDPVINKKSALPVSVMI